MEIAALPAKNALLVGSTCSCSLPTTHGLPCRHTLYKHITGAIPLELKQVHKHWWNYRPVTLVQEQPITSSMPDIPLNPLAVKGKGRPFGAIATKKGEGIKSTKRLHSAFEHELKDELATAIPSSTAPPVLQKASKSKARGRPRKQQQQPQQPQQPQPQQQETHEADCIVVAGASGERTSTPTEQVTTTSLGLQRLSQAGEDTFQPGTICPPAHQCIIDGLEIVNPDAEDMHDALLRDLEADGLALTEDDLVFQDGNDETA